MSVNELPDDVIEYIILHLLPYGDQQSCRSVSRRWHRVATGAIHRLNTLFLRCNAFEWYQLQQSSSSRSAIAERCTHAAVVHGAQMFVFGGCTASYTTFNDLWRFDLAQRAWTRPNPQGTYPSPKACATMLEYNGQLLLFGGWAKSSPNPIHQTVQFFNELHLYNPVTNVWTDITSGAAPHLAGHSAAIVGSRMVVFGGSMGNSSSNAVWVYDIPSAKWTQPVTSAIGPAPRYGQSQLKLDERHLLIVGGCGGPNMIFSDVWLLTLPEMAATDQTWQWEEVTVTNAAMGAPQLWSHPSCLVGSKLVVLSKPHRSRNAASYRNMSTTFVHGEVDSMRMRAPPPPQGNLIPPRRKLLSSKSLDEHDAPVSPSKTAPKRTCELHRASSIPAIIVGEIPKLVVTKDNSADSTESADGTAVEAPAVVGSACISLVSSSLLPSQASPAAAVPQRRAHPSVKPNASCDRGRQLQMLRRMEEYIQSKRRGGGHGGDEATASTSRVSPKTPTFRFSSPPPKSKQQRPTDLVMSRNPMCIYTLDLTEVLSKRSATWSTIEAEAEAPEDTILYSLVVGRGELIMFGGMHNGVGGEQQALDVLPSTHTITNETFILRPPITL